MASPAQVSQLVLQVDAQVAVAQRSLQDLARVVKQSADGMNTSIDTTVQAHTRLNGAFNNARLAQMELSHVVRASVDDYAAGASPLRIMTLEMSRLAEAAELMGGGGGGALGKLGAFMQGPWGIAVLFGVSILGQLFAKMSEGGASVAELVEKMRKQAQQAQLNKAAEDIWANSIDGLIDRNEKLVETLQKRLKAEEDVDAQALRGAQADKARADQELQAAKTQLNNLLAQQKAQAGSVQFGASGAATSGVMSQFLTQQIADAQQRVKTAEKGVADATHAIEQSTITVGQNTGKAMASASAAVDLFTKDYLEALHQFETVAPGYTAQIEAAFDRVKAAMSDAASGGVGFKKTSTAAVQLARDLLSGKIGVDQYTSGMNALAKALKAVVDAAKEAKKGAGEFGKQIGFAEAESIAKSAGLTVTSGYRSVADQARLYNDPRYNHPGNPVARPGASAHNGINGRWALDIAFGPGITAQSLKKLYGDQGVTLSAVYKETGHYHIEGSTSQATAAQKAADRAAQKQRTDDDQFAKESSQLDAETLAAKKQLTTDFDTQARYAEAELKAQEAAQLDAIKKQVDGKQLTAVQGQILSSKVKELTATKQAVLDHQKYIHDLEQAGKAIDQQYGFQLDDLKFADEQASTQAERRKLQLEILDIQYQQKQADLERLKKTQEANGDLDSAKLTQDQLNRLPTQKAQDQERVRNSTMDPLEAWAKQVPQSAAEINQALQSIEVQGIDNLASSIGEVITGTKSLGQAFKDISSQIVSDIVQMTVKMLIFRAISGMFGGGSGIGSGTLADGGNFSSTLLGSIPHFAGGGSMIIGGNPGVDQNVLSLNGKPIAMVGQGEALNVTPRVRLGGANNNQNGPIAITIGFGSAPEFAPYVQDVAAAHANQAVEISVNHTNQTLRTLARPKLGG